MQLRTRSSAIIQGLLVCAALLCGFNALAADPGVANVTELDGKAFAAVSGGAMRTLRTNDKLYQGERVITGRDSELEFKFTDGTTITLGESTIVNVDAYAYRKTAAAPEAETESFSMSILRGTVRAFTGLLAKRRPGRVRFKTKVATIGIRGTHFAAEVEGDSATIILLAQEDAGASNAIEVSNEFGKVDIDKAGWGTEIPDAMSPPSPPRKMRSTQSMNRIIRSIQTNRRVVVPRTHMR